MDFAADGDPAHSHSRSAATDLQAASLDEAHERGHIANFFDKVGEQVELVKDAVKDKAEERLSGARWLCVQVRCKVRMYGVCVCPCRLRAGSHRARWV